MQAIILAAGMGKRLKELTKDNTKCMVKVDGITLIERLLRQLDNYQLDRIVIVLGYKGNVLKEFINKISLNNKIEYIFNEIYDSTNNIYSLSLAKQQLSEHDTLLFESDLIFENAVLDRLISDERPDLAVVDKFENWMDGTCVELDENDNILAVTPGKKFDFSKQDKYFKTVNIYKFSKEFSMTHYIPFLEAYTKALGNNEYYEQVLRVIALLDNPQIKGMRLSGETWYEIDDIQDLDIATTLFTKNKRSGLKLIKKRYGGYWRYPKVLDYCYLVNPYFPPERLKNEMKASFDNLLMQYPSGMGINSLLAGKIFDIPVDNIVVGNGAAELIKLLLDNLIGKIGIVRPSFDEYYNRIPFDKVVAFSVSNKQYRYFVQDIIEFFEDKEISSLVIVNPDNPSGNYINKEDMRSLLHWAKDRKITLIIDESFIDFAEEKNATLLDKTILKENNNLIIIKSLSKSYGIPGLRLGVLISSDDELIAKIKRDASIWNINSFAEYFMQIFEKYRKDYDCAIEKFKEERVAFKRNLEAIPGIEVFDSEANYFMIRLNTSFFSVDDLTEKLFFDYGILIKSLTEKLPEDNCIRVAIRDKESNCKFIRAVREVINQCV